MSEPETLFDLMPHITRWCGIHHEENGITLACGLEYGHEGEHEAQPFPEFGGPVYTWTD